jgi:hypothetical protein
MLLLVAVAAYLGDKMVFSRVGSTKSEDQSALEWLEEQAAKGEITEEELQVAIAEYEANAQRAVEPESYEMMREQYKREKAKDNFESGKGGFRRSS